MKRASRPNLRRDAGVSLIELLIVLVVVAVGVLALAGVQTRSTGTVVSSGRNTRALSLAQEKIEIARAAGFGVAVSDSGVSSGYNWLTRVNNVSTGLDRVTVTVSWTEGANARNIQLNTLLSTR